MDFNVENLIHNCRGIESESELRKQSGHGFARIIDIASGINGLHIVSALSIGEDEVYLARATARRNRMQNVSLRERERERRRN